MSMLPVRSNVVQMMEQEVSRETGEPISAVHAAFMDASGDGDMCDDSGLHTDGSCLCEIWWLMEHSDDRDD